MTINCIQSRAVQKQVVGASGPRALSPLTSALECSPRARPLSAVLNTSVVKQSNHKIMLYPGGEGNGYKSLGNVFLSDC